MKAFKPAIELVISTLIVVVFLLIVSGFSGRNVDAQNVLPQPLVSDVCVVDGKPMILDSKYIGNDDIMLYITYVRNDGMIVSSYVYTKGGQFGSYEIIQTGCPSLR